MRRVCLRRLRVRLDAEDVRLGVLKGCFGGIIGSLSLLRRRSREDITMS